MKGLQGKQSFTNYLTEIQRKTLERLAEIEQEDADRCAGCGGEDCICCEYYQDRQRWVEPEELFEDWGESPFADEFVPIEYDYDDEDEEEREY